jgi:hypothetical protein
MPFLISGNIEKIEKSGLIEFQKKFGFILSNNQFFQQQYNLICKQVSISYHLPSLFLDLEKKQQLSFVFLLSQFGDTIDIESPPSYLDFKGNPYVLEWKRGSYMIPWEVLDVFMEFPLFKEQNYLFSLLNSIPLKEKKDWMKWLGVDINFENEKDLNRELYKLLRVFQKPFKGKSFITEKEFPINHLWKKGENPIVDWYFKGLTGFYYTMNELSKQEHDPFIVRVLSEIKAGKYVIKKEPERFREREEYKLVATMEGGSIQYRETIFDYELESKNKDGFLFQNF